MSATNFNTKNDTFRKLMGNGLTYNIPRFQRDYSWTVEEWEDLWMDILGTIRDGGEPAHYMGYRLGNMTLMARGANRDVGNQSYTLKRAVYAESTYAIIRKVSEDNADWMPERISARQNWMANQATAIWRIDPLS